MASELARMPEGITWPSVQVRVPLLATSPINSALPPVELPNPAMGS